MRKILIFLFCITLLGCFKNDTSEHIEISVKDLTAPTITIKNKNITITEGDKFNIDEYYSVTDNMDSSPKITVDDSYKTDTPGKYKITITATDADGNETSGVITLTVKEKEKPKPVQTEKPSTDNSTQNEVPDNSQIPVTQPEQNEPQQSSPVITPTNPSQSYFPFLEGEHDGGEAAIGRCLSAGWATCGPVDNDGDGVYDGIKGS